jgi:hypothetical protein
MAPESRAALRDERMASMTARALTNDVLLRIPLGTVALEEIAFRGVLPALCGEPISCLVFGLWHIAPTRLGLDLNGITSPPARAGAIVVAFGATAIAGKYLCWLRRQGGLAAPMTAHATVNGLCAIAAVIAHRKRSADSGPLRPRLRRGVVDQRRQQPSTADAVDGECTFAGAEVAVAAKKVVAEGPGIHHTIGGGPAT